MILSVTVICTVDHLPNPLTPTPPPLKPKTQAKVAFKEDGPCLGFIQMKYKGSGFRCCGLGGCWSGWVVYLGFLLYYKYSVFVTLFIASCYMLWNWLPDCGHWCVPYWCLHAGWPRPRGSVSCGAGPRRGRHCGERGRGSHVREER